MSSGIVLLCPDLILNSIFKIFSLSSNSLWLFSPFPSSESFSPSSLSPSPSSESFSAFSPSSLSPSPSSESFSPSSLSPSPSSESFSAFTPSSLSPSPSSVSLLFSTYILFKVSIFWSFSKYNNFFLLYSINMLCFFCSN